MKFGEKVRQLRTEKKLSQTELGRLCGLSLRTIRNYEVAGRYPKKREVYSKLATALGCNVNYLLSESEDVSDLGAITAELTEESRIQILVSEITSYFSDPHIPDNEKASVMRTLKVSYSIAKKRNKKKFAQHIMRTPKFSGKA